jgi:hypothetical protein
MVEAQCARRAGGVAGDGLDFRVVAGRDAFIVVEGCEAGRGVAQFEALMIEQEVLRGRAGVDDVDPVRAVAAALPRFAGGRRVHVVERCTRAVMQIVKSARGSSRPGSVGVWIAFVAGIQVKLLCHGR